MTTRNIVQAATLLHESVSNLSVPPSSEVTIQIALPDANKAWESGILYLYLPNTIAYTSRRRFSAAIMFGVDFNDAQSMATQNQYINVSAHFWNFPIMKGWRYQDDGALSTVEFATNNAQIRLKKCRIVGNNVELTIENTHGSTTGSFTAEIECVVWQ